MDKYIKQESAINACYDGFADCRDDCAANIKNLPAEDVAPVRHGRWIELENGDCKCSLCGCYHHTWEAYGYYCQHCGARMDGDNNDLP